MTADRPDYLAQAAETLRAFVLKRDGHACRNCGFGDRLQAHAWVPPPEHRAAGGDPALAHPAGLVTLCEVCHEALTRARTERAGRPGVRPGDPTHNVFELWRLNGEQLPFRVVKHTWSRSVAQFYEVEKIEIRTWPYGAAWGRYVREDEVGGLTRIPNAGTYSWRMYRDPKA